MRRPVVDVDGGIFGRDKKKICVYHKKKIQAPIVQWCWQSSCSSDADRREDDGSHLDFALAF